MNKNKLLKYIFYNQLQPTMISGVGQNWKQIIILFYIELCAFYVSLNLIYKKMNVNSPCMCKAYLLYELVCVEPHDWI